MSSDRFWELFAQTGDIAYYILYRKRASGAGAREKNERRSADTTALR